MKNGWFFFRSSDKEITAPICVGSRRYEKRKRKTKTTYDMESLLFAIWPT